MVVVVVAAVKREFLVAEASCESAYRQTDSPVTGWSEKKDCWKFLTPREAICCLHFDTHSKKKGKYIFIKGTHQNAVTSDDVPGVCSGII